ncbi:MAG: hypothetical protein DMG68_10055 [Acidobacteria bacterium]|nr:MAG: hypothetical protein DMG68_10055 [Acidobacteriota bacterium]
MGLRQDSGRVLAEEIGFDIALSHSLNAGVAMEGGPAAGGGVIFESSVITRAMILLANVAKQQALVAFTSHAKADRIPRAYLGTTRTGLGITQVTALAYLIIGRNLIFKAGSGAMTTPHGA